MRSGVERETERVLLENYDKYYRLAYSYMKSEQDALDVVQESAYKAIRDCGQVKEQRYIGTWLYRIVVNTALDALRRRGREVALENGRRTAGSHPTRAWSFGRFWTGWMRRRGRWWCCGIFTI